MPTVNGVMYAEGRPLLHNFSELNILLLGALGSDLRNFTLKVEALHNYLENTVRSSIAIKLHCTNLVSDSVALSLDITRHDINPSTNEELFDAVNKFDVDIVFDQIDQFDQKYLWSKFYEFDCVKSLAKLNESVENYLVGNGIAWSFIDPFWNMPLTMKYLAIPGICMDYFTFMGDGATKKGYTDVQKEKVRYITNKIQQIEYSRDILQYYIKRTRKAKRNDLSEDDYNLQLNYHLSGYYFLVAGTLDSLARLINDKYRLGLTRYSDLAIEKDNFIDANRRKRTGFVRIFKNKKFIEWITFLKERRNFVAHDGDMRQTPLVKEKKVLLTDAEVNSIVDKQLDWPSLARYIPANLLQAQRAQAVQLVRVENDYDVIAEKIMMIPTPGGGHKLHSPLIDIDHDYGQFTEIMSKVLDRLRK